MQLFGGIAGTVFFPDQKPIKRPQGRHFSIARADLVVLSSEVCKIPSYFSGVHFQYGSYVQMGQELFHVATVCLTGMGRKIAFDG
jgi:hypothetical protein